MCLRRLRCFWKNPPSGLPGNLGLTASVLSEMFGVGGRLVHGHRESSCTLAVQLTPPARQPPRSTPRNSVLLPDASGRRQLGR
uniref:Uncharacterized protein n=1 Tax=Mustela putorius furo TaxID=9669 RepID=M3YUM5_MUSPF